ncbi:DUF1254 domain-containing protein [Streptomyces sp. NPDC005549]|uniref:DUF1254 domain-containing protein n=1 Tax=Streptomyces sp. NPDC005549 TaxID=3154888 RepID=UPI0033AB8FFC
MADEQLERLATQAWLYGYPLVTAAVTKDVMTAVAARDDERRKGPVNQFCYMHHTPDPTFTEVVSPNADTLYSSAWLDLSTEPLVLSLPDFGDRYWMVPILNAWSDVVGAPGCRQDGSTAGPFLLAGPSWSGQAPQGMTVLKSSTAINWIIDRYAAAGPSDYAAVHLLQDGNRLTPLSRWTGDPEEYTPPSDVSVAGGFDAVAAPVSQVHRLSGRTYFARLNQLLVDNPPNPADAASSRARDQLLGSTPAPTGGWSQRIESPPIPERFALGQVRPTVLVHYGSPLTTLAGQDVLDKAEDVVLGRRLRAGAGAAEVHLSGQYRRVCPSRPARHRVG